MDKEQIKSNLLAVREGLRKLMVSRPYMLFISVLAGVLFIFNLAHVSLWIFLTLIGICFLIYKEFTPTFLHFNVMWMTLLKLYGAKPHDFFHVIPLLCVLVICFIAHFVIYKKNFRSGKLLWAHIAVSVALIFGGLFSISAEAYFKPTALFYVLGLSVGMVAIYILGRSCIGADEGIDVMRIFTDSLFFIGVTGVIMTASAAIPALLTGESYSIQWSNNLSAFMAFALPVPFYYAVKYERKVLYFLTGVIFYLATFFTLSRGGMLYSTFIVAVSAIFSIVFCKSKKVSLILTAVSAACLIVAVCAVISKFDVLMEELHISPNEARVKMFKLAIANFKKFPVFGTGIGFYGDFYHPQEGAMYWYHSTPFQIIGSMGTVGIIAYTYQFFVRLKVLLAGRNAINYALLIAFVGFELLALVNPGDFVPVPFVMNLTLMFAYVEYFNTLKLPENELLVPVTKLKKQPRITVA